MTSNPGTRRSSPVVVESDPLPPGDRAGDRGFVLDRLYRSQGPRLLRFFSRRAPPQDASDLVNESFLRLANARTAELGDVDHEEAYLQQIAKNVLRNRARAAFHRSTVRFDPDDGLPQPSADLTTLIETRDELARLQTALLKLNPKTREIFMAHRLDGATYAEIAGRMGLSVKGVEWHMSKAIALVHRALDRR
jgi:RNA polymerase sigma factor (sigma-70 family)